GAEAVAWPARETETSPVLVHPAGSAALGDPGGRRPGHFGADDAAVHQRHPGRRGGRVRVCVFGLLSGGKPGLAEGASMNEPSPKGRSGDGRFAPGNQIATGNPGNKRMRELRKALIDSATPEAVREVGEALQEMARGGDVQAAKVWLDH